MCSSNGEAERAVQLNKNLLKKSVDSYLSLLAYRKSPLKAGKSPVEISMDRSLRNRVPALGISLEPK